MTEHKMGVKMFIDIADFRTYAVVRFIGYDESDIVPTKWLTLEETEGDTVGVWYPDCHADYPEKCLKLVRAAKEPDRATSKVYMVKLMYTTGLRMLCASSCTCNNM